MAYYDSFQKLFSLFRVGEDIDVEYSDMFIRNFSFSSRCFYSEFSQKNNSFIVSDSIAENRKFKYPVFISSPGKKYKEVIILLHGLNERTWHKYLPWAEYLCKKTEKPVLLFPIAYHMNRSPGSWSNPRILQNILDFRKSLFKNDRSISFANVALSMRLSDNPHRFYTSGCQSANDIVKLVGDIKSGRHELFEKETKIDFFAYSIGAFLSQILFLSNPDGYFDDSKLFMFCGGSIFNSMSGQSRSIMDKKTFEILLDYYQADFWSEQIATDEDNGIMASFISMLKPENGRGKRISTFERLKNRISGISLSRDKVIPYSGIVQAMGQNCVSETISLMDFPYEYTHEAPFPLLKNEERQHVESSFAAVFERASDFLSG